MTAIHNYPVALRTITLPSHRLSHPKEPSRHFITK